MGHGGPGSLPGNEAQDLTSLSCPSAGNCGAGGYAINGNSVTLGQTFVSGERNGVWAKAERMPGTWALNKGDLARVESVSCPSASHCTAAGFYADAKGHHQGFVGGR